MNKKILILFFIFFTAGLITAQQFSATVDKTTVGENERFQAYFDFEGPDMNKLSSFAPPSFEGFRVLSGPNQSTSMQIINGKMSSSLTYSFILQATEKGTYEIDPASVQYDGKRLTTKPITVTVVQGSAGQQQNNSQGAGGISNQELAESVFIRAIPDRKSVYRGEQMTVTYKLYTKLNISSPQVSKLPTYKGFWSEDLETGNTLNFEIEMYNGERFRTAVIKKVALFPTQAGELTITPFELNVPVLIRRKTRSRDLFDEFFNDSFFGRTETIDYAAASAPLKINVKPLPEGAPASFNGAVGNFDLKASLEANEAKTNEPVTLKVNVSGTGNIKLIDIPQPELPAGFEKYDPKTNENIKRSGNTISGSKTMELLLVPRIPGKKEIPAVEFSYFNPSSGRYVTEKEGPFTLNIEKGEGEYEPAVSGYAREDVKLLSEDIRFINTSSVSLIKEKEAALLGVWFYISLILPAFLLAGVIIFTRRREKLAGNTELLKYTKARKKAQARLKEAKKALEANDQTRFYGEIAIALEGYLEDKLGIQKSDFTIEKAVEKLQEKGVSQATADRVKAISDKCEFARFAPKTGNFSAEKELYEETMNVIVEIENELTKKKRG